MRYCLKEQQFFLFVCFKLSYNLPNIKGTIRCSLYIHLVGLQIEPRALHTRLYQLNYIPSLSLDDSEKSLYPSPQSRSVRLPSPPKHHPCYSFAVTSPSSSPRPAPGNHRMVSCHFILVSPASEGAVKGVTLWRLCVHLLGLSMLYLRSESLCASIVHCFLLHGMAVPFYPFLR